jgi:predicted dehydrogenase
MYLIHWLLGMPVSASSAFTLACENPSANAKNADRVEDNAVTVMSFEGGAIAINETGFCSNCAPIVFEAHGEKGFVRMEDDYAVSRIIKRTQATRGKPVEVTPAPNQNLPITQFVKGEILEGCGLEEALALTHMMVMAYK